MEAEANETVRESGGTPTGILHYVIVEVVKKALWGRGPGSAAPAAEDVETLREWYNDNARGMIETAIKAMTAATVCQASEGEQGEPMKAEANETVMAKHTVPCTGCEKPIPFTVDPESVADIYHVMCAACGRVNLVAFKGSPLEGAGAERIPATRLARLCDRCAQRIVFTIPTAADGGSGRYLTHCEACKAKYSLTIEEIQ